MLMSGFFLFFALFLGYTGAFVTHQLVVLVRNWRLARQQLSAQEEGTIEETVEKVGEEAADSTREDSHVSLTLLDPDLLECPICCELLKAPIFQCTNGHLACSLCPKKLKNLCPSCQFPIGYNRCRAMEKVIEAFIASCPNAKYGCKENVSYVDRSSHEKQCVFAPCSCPVHDCNYTGSHKDLKNHVNNNHKEGLIRFEWETPLAIEFSLSEKITIFREEKDGELIVVQGWKGWHGMFVSMSCIAPSATKAGRFSCHLELKTSRSTLKQRFTVKKIQKMREEQPEDDFVLIPSYMLRRRFNMRICISRDQYIHYALLMLKKFRGFFFKYLKTV